MSLRQQAAKGVVWSAVQAWGARAVTFLINLLLARLLLPEAFGIVAFATVFIAFAQIFLDQGFGDAIVQRPDLEREHLDTAFWVNIGTGVLLTLIGLAAARPLELLFDRPQLAPVITWLSFNFIIGSLISVQRALLKRGLAFKSLAVRSLAATTVSGIIAVAMAFLGYGVWALVAKILINSLVSVVVLWSVSDWRPRFAFSVPHFRQLYHFGINVVGSNFVDFFSRNADNFLIGYFLGSTALGYYTLAYSLLSVMTETLISVPNTVVFPTFSQLGSTPERMKQPFYEVTQLQSVIAFPIFVGLLAVAPEAIVFLYGAKWAPSIPVAQVLMLMGILFSAFYFYGNVIKAAGRPNWRFRILAFASVLNVIGFTIAVRWGITAVAAAYVIASLMTLPAYFAVIHRLIGADFATHLRQYVPAVISSLVMVAAVLGVKAVLGAAPVPARLAASVAAGALAYLLALSLVRPGLLRQLRGMAQMMLPRLKSKTS